MIECEDGGYVKYEEYIELYNKFLKTESSLVKAQSENWDYLCEKEGWDRFYK